MADVCYFEPIKLDQIFSTWSGVGLAAWQSRSMAALRTTQVPQITAIELNSP